MLDYDDNANTLASGIQRCSPQRVGIAVMCATCGRMKKPRGRSAALQMASSLCDSDACEGYTNQPLAGMLWPGELCCDFGYHHSHDGTAVVG